MSNRSLRAELIAALLVLTSLVAGGNAIAQATPASPRAYLQRMDSNGDGRVDEDEYVAYMSRGFARMDTDGNGVLEGDELPPGARRITLAEHQ